MEAIALNDVGIFYTDNLKFKSMKLKMTCF